jgi:hypothetical protein
MLIIFDRQVPFWMEKSARVFVKRMVVIDVHSECGEEFVAG